MAYEFSRRIKDAALTVTKAFPAAGANTNTGTIDLGSTSAYNQGQGFELEIYTPALSGFTNSAKVITYTVQHSSDDSTYTDVGISFTVAGVATTGSLENIKQFRLPSDVKRYIQVNIAETSAGADITGSSAIVSLRF